MELLLFRLFGVWPGSSAWRRWPDPHLMLFLDAFDFDLVVSREFSLLVKTLKTEPSHTKLSHGLYLLGLARTSMT